MKIYIYVSLRKHEVQPIAFLVIQFVSFWNHLPNWFCNSRGWFESFNGTESSQSLYKAHTVVFKLHLLLEQTHQRKRDIMLLGNLPTLQPKAKTRMNSPLPTYQHLVRSSRTIPSSRFRHSQLLYERSECLDICVYALPFLPW